MIALPLTTKRGGRKYLEFHRSLLWMLTFFCLWCCSVPILRAQGTLTSVVPSRAATQEEVGAVLPFVGNGSDVQAIYGQSALSPVLPSSVPVTITQIAFRVDGPTGRAIDTTIPDIEIHMSTSLAPFSFRYANNRGMDETVVFSRGALSWKSTTSSQTGPNPFSLVVKLDKPFVYQPGSGNLVIEFFIYQGLVDQSSNLDGGGPGTAGIAGPLGPPEAAFTSSAPVLQLTYLPVPEPRWFAFILSGFLIATLFRKAIH